MSTEIDAPPVPDNGASAATGKTQTAHGATNGGSSNGGATNGGATNGGSATPTALPTVQFIKDQFHINKNDYASAWVIVARRGDLKTPISVNVATDGGTAMPDIDYQAFSEQLDFAPGESQKKVQIQMTDRLLSEDSRTVNLQLHDPKGAVLGEPREAQLEIAHYDSPFFKSVAVYRTHFKIPQVVKATFLTASTVLKHALLALLLILMIWGLSEWFSYKAETQAQIWIGKLMPNTQVKITFAQPTPTPPAVQATSKGRTPTAPNKAIATPPVSEAEQARLTDQLRRIRDRAEFHLDVMKFFYTRYYMTILTFSISAALAAITLVLVSKRGWEQSNQYVMTAFFIMTACTVFYSAFPGVFQQSENIQANKNLYRKYDALENELLSFAVTGGSLKKLEVKEKVAAPGKNATAAEPLETITNRSLTTKEFIHYVDEQLEKGDIAIGFDYSKVANYKEAFDTDR